MVLEARAMTTPEANQQYDLWVDRCRQQLERGAAGNALAAWMQSEGVSAEMAAAILQAARGQPAADSGQPAHQDPAPATTPETAVPETTAPETTAPETTVPETTTPQGETVQSGAADTALPNQDGAGAASTRTRQTACHTRPGIWKSGQNDPWRDDARSARSRPAGCRAGR
jgi:hypothetical protein